MGSLESAVSMPVLTDVPIVAAHLYHFQLIDEDCMFVIPLKKDVLCMFVVPLKTIKISSASCGSIKNDKITALHLRHSIKNDKDILYTFIVQLKMIKMRSASLSFHYKIHLSISLNIHI